MDRQIAALEARLGVEPAREEVALPPADVWAEMALGVKLDDWQRQVMLSTSKTLLSLCCRQSGKSTVTGARAAYDALRYPGETSVAVAPSYRQSRLLAAKIAAPLRSMGVRFVETKDDIRLGNGSVIVVLPGDPETIRGHTVTPRGSLLLDEASYASPGLWAAALPMVAATGGRIVALTSPGAPTGVVYEMSRDPEVETIRVKASDLPRFDAGLIAQLRRRLGPARAQQELDAEFGAVAGGLFSAAIIAAMQKPLTIDRNIAEADERAYEARAAADAAEVARGKVYGYHRNEVRRRPMFHGAPMPARRF